MMQNIWEYIDMNAAVEEAVNPNLNTTLLNPDSVRSLGEDTGLRWYATLRFRLIVSVALVHAILMGAFIWDAVGEQSDSIRAELQNRGRALSSMMAMATTNALLAEDLASLAEVIGRIRNQPDVSYGEVLDAQGNILASTDPARVGLRVVPRIKVSEHMPLKAGDHVLDLRENIHVAGRDVGAVFVGMSTDNLHKALAATRNEGLLFILIALVVGSFAAWALSFATTRNLHSMTVAVRKLTGGDLNVRVKTRGHDEVGLLARAFNTMVASLQRTSHQVRMEHEKRTEAERLACVGELSASIAHEIRNPLSAIINSVKLLSRGDLHSGDRGQVIDIVNAESERLQRILNDFLTFSRIPQSEMRPIDLCQLVRDTVTLLSNDPKLPRNVVIDTRLPQTQCMGRMDKDQIRQVLMNLIINGVQAMPDGGTLIVEVEPEPDRLQVHIIDAGTGIPDAMIDKITHPFVTGRKDGTGLGLSIVQRILMQHGSKLDIVSHPETGTEMSFSLNTAMN
jgi:two-component system sensor histidine kinase HydH